MQETFGEAEIATENYKMNFTLMNKTLRKYIVETDIQEKRRIELLMNEMLRKNPIDENLKNTDPLKWTGLMNNYKHCAEEIVFRELIYI